MTDRILLTDLRFEARHGVYDWERDQDQPFEVDVELALDLRPAGTTDDLTRTIDYGRVYTTVAGVVTGRSFQLIEALAEAIAGAILADLGDAGVDLESVVVRVRKPGVQLGGPLAYAGVEITRRPGP